MNTEPVGSLLSSLVFTYVHLFFAETLQQNIATRFPVSNTRITESASWSQTEPHDRAVPRLSHTPVGKQIRSAERPATFRNTLASAVPSFWRLLLVNVPTTNSRFRKQLSSQTFSSVR